MTEAQSNTPAPPTTDERLALLSWAYGKLMACGIGSGSNMDSALKMDAIKLVLTQPKESFRNTGTLERDGDVIAEFERNEEDFPDQVGKLYISGSWFDVQEAREMRDFLNGVIP